MSYDSRLAPDKVLLDGKIVTVDSHNSIAEAVAIKDGPIIAVGNSAEIKVMIGKKTEVV